MFYKILNRFLCDDCEVFEVELQSDCAIYQGHFPGEPIVPGVCNIQMVKECAERVVNQRLLLSNIQRVRFTTLMKPEVHNHCFVRFISLNETDSEVAILATIGDDAGNVYVDLKAELEKL